MVECPERHHEAISLGVAMRAAVFHEMGKEEITYHEDVEVSDPGPGEVKVRIHAAGVCHSDLSAMNGTLPQPAPAVLGHEGAGEIVAVGEGVTTIKVGDHVIIAWTPPCGVCNPCLRGEANLCISIFFQIAGSQRFTVGGEPAFGFAGTGTFVEEMVVPVQGVVKIPDDVPYEIGALIGCGVTTGVGAALNTAQVKPGSTVVVFGAGGVGIAAIQGARIAGAAEIVAVDMVPQKLEDAKRFGATHGTDPDGVDALNMQDQLGGGVRLRHRVHRDPPDDPSGVRRSEARRYCGHRRSGKQRGKGRVQRVRAVLHVEEASGQLLRIS